jgi:mannitol operon transcriptional antiterminator
MATLNSRQAAIAAVLLESQGPISAARLGEKVGLSARVVRYNLPLVQRWLGSREVRLKVERRTGFTIEASAAARQSAARDLAAGDSRPLLLTSAERRHLLLFELFTQEGDLADNDLRLRISSSRATLSRDLTTAEGWLRGYNLYLQRRPRLRTLLVGREDDMRHALVSLILESGSEAALLDLCLWGKKPGGRVDDLKRPAQRSILERIGTWKLNDAWRSISCIEAGLVGSFADSDHLTLALYWAVMVQRVQGGHAINLPDGHIDAQRRLPEYPAVHAAAELLRREAGIRLPPAEEAQLTLEVITSRRPPEGGASEALGAPAGNGYYALALRLAQEIGRRMEVDLAQPEVLARLAEHLSRSVTRVHHGLPIRNPLTPEVRRAYPALWDATSEAARGLADDLNAALPQEEIAYITMYMGMALELRRRLERNVGRRVVIVCPSGGVTAWMLLSRLKSELPELEVVDVMSIRYLGKFDRESADAVISTAELSSCPLPVITVSPLVTGQDIERIRRRLGLGG